MDLSVNLAPRHKTELHLRNPIMTASGTLGSGLELARHYDLEAIGALVSPTTTWRPRRGRSGVRVTETPAGILHASGYPNPGAGALVKTLAPVWERWPVPVLVSIAGDSVEEYGRLAARFEGVPGIAGLEVNLWPPDADSDGPDLGQSPADAAGVVREVAASTSLPMLVKLPAAVPDIRRLAEAVERAGAQAITVPGTVPGLAIDVAHRRPVLAAGSGRLSGAAVKPLAMRNVYLAAAVVEIPIVASGGVMSGDDAVEFVMAGATAVQVGSATFRDPSSPWRILDEFRAWCTTEGVTRIDDIRGAAHGRD